MTPPFKRLEVWSDTVTNSGVRKAVIPVATRCQETEEIVTNAVQSRLVFTVTMAWADRSELVVRRVVRITYADDTYTEYRIATIEDQSGGVDLITVTCLGMLYDLAERSALVSQTVNNVVQYSFPISGAIATLVANYVVAFAPAWFGSGSSTPSGNVEVQVNNDTPLSLALKLTAAIGVVAGAEYQYRVYRNGTTNYQWAIDQYNSGLATADIRTGKSLVGSRRSIQTDAMTNRLVALGSDGGTVGDAQWKVTAVSVNTYIEITEIGGAAYNPIGADDQFNTTFYWIHEDGVSHQITDTDRTNKRFYMSSTTGIATGEWGRIAVNSGGDQLAYLDDPSSQSTYGVRVGVKTFDSPTHTNWIKNADLSDWSGSLPTDWTSPAYADPSKITTAGYWLTGGKSARFTGGTTTDFQSTRTIYMTAGTTVTYTAWVRMDAWASSAAFGYIQFTNPQSGATENVALDGTDAEINVLGSWVSASRSYPITSSGTKTLTVYVYHQTGAGTDCYFDSAQFSVTPEAVDFVVGSGAALMWLKGIQYLDSYADPVTRFDVSLVDLYRIDSVTWSSEAFSLGGTVRLTDTALSESTQYRVVKVDTNHLLAYDTKVSLATNAPQLTRLLAA